MRALMLLQLVLRHAVADPAAPRELVAPPLLRNTGQTPVAWAVDAVPCSDLALGEGEWVLAFNASAGGGKVVSHPRWGGNVYPASLMTAAPTELVASVVAAAGAPT